MRPPRPRGSARAARGVPLSPSSEHVAMPEVEPLDRLVLEVERELQLLGDGLADADRAETLQVRDAFEEEDAPDQRVGVLHLVDRLLAVVLRERRRSPSCRASWQSTKYWLTDVSSAVRTSLSSSMMARVALHAHEASCARRPVHVLRGGAMNGVRSSSSSAGQQPPHSAPAPHRAARSSIDRGRTRATSSSITRSVTARQWHTYTPLG